MEPDASLCNKFYLAWKWFDSWFGWLMGLDTPKYDWAIGRYHEMQRNMLQARNTPLRELEMGDTPQFSDLESQMGASSMKSSSEIAIESSHPISLSSS